MEGKKRAGADGVGGSNVKTSSAPSRLSYRDKLMAPGCAGFLMKHNEEDDIVRGWKGYFHRINEENIQTDVEETEEDVNQMERRLEGKAGVFNFTVEEYTAWCLPWRNSLIIKVLGASFPTYVIRDRINRMWRPKDPLKLIPLSNGYYIVSFSNKEDRDYAFEEGPWMIEDHYLIVQRWRPNFNPWKADLQCRIAAWVRLPDVPFEFYNIESLRRIGHMIGRMIKIDRSTSIYYKGGFARICVELDLQQPLLPSYMIFGEERPIIYEGLHHVCFKCGKYGHQKETCPTVQREEDDQKAERDQSNVAENTGDKGSEVKPAPVESGDGVNNATGDTGSDLKPVAVESGDGGATATKSEIPGASPFSKLQILRQAPHGASFTMAK
ncbi:hypothetical protein K1719_011895 [Acacia pycnantha]|nr:hypothetical protein K1719_011895 [Acacia pycnantha]